MPRKYEMSWEPEPAYRWVKMYKGTRYRVSCADLGVARARWSKDESYREANAWWAAKKAELEAAHPHREELDELARKLAYLKAHDLPEEVPAIELAAANTEQAQPDDPLPVPPDMTDLLDALRKAGCTIPQGIDDRVLRELAPSAGLWADRFRRDPQDAPERTLAHWAERWLAVREEQARSGARAASGLRLLRALVREFTEFCGAVKVEQLDAGLWERWGHHCEGMVARRDDDPRKGWKAGYARALYTRSRNLMTWLWEQEAIPSLPRNIKRNVNLTRPADEIRTYTNYELHEFFKAAQGQHKLHILLALNCGMYEVDIARLLRREIDLRDGRITRRRSKTRKLEHTPVVTYPLWPSTLAMLREHVCPDGDLALRTPEGNPWRATKLVGDKWVESHSVANYHGELRRKLGLTGPFKTFRKTSASKLGSDHRYDKLANHFLGEAPTSTADKHYVQTNTQRFAEAVLWLGREFDLLTVD
jgi:integrase